MPSSEAHPLEGTWELESGEALADGVLSPYADQGLVSRKVLGPGHFSFVSHNAQGFYAAASGTWTAAEGRYVERPDLSSYPPLIGQDFAFHFSVEGDLWTNARWEAGVRVEFERWRRV